MTSMISLPAGFSAHAEVAGIDLHMHSQASDGALMPAELMQLCHHRGLGRVALTDHDTLSGIAEARCAAQTLNLGLLAGAELSSQWKGVGIHVVVLLPQGEHLILEDTANPLHQLLAQLHIARSERSKTIAERLEKKGFANALACARAHAGGRDELGRPHFAAAMVEAGMVRDMKEAFKRYLGAGKVGDVKALWPELGDVVATIKAGGGVAVLAHPLRYELTRRRLNMLLDDFVAAGGESVEITSGYQNTDRTRDLARMLGERNVYGSIGSDFHKVGGPLAPGTFSPPTPCAVPPIWQHPALRDWFETTEPCATQAALRRHALREHAATCSDTEK